MSRRRRGAAPTWKRNTLAGAVTLALSSLPAASALATTCPGSPSSTACSLTGTDSMSISDSGAIDVSGTQPAITISSDSGISLTNDGTISARDTGATSAHAIAIYDSGDLNGTITNAGTISATANVNASGAYAHAYADYVTGVHVTSTLNGSLSNNGTVSAIANANATATATSSQAETYGVYSVYTGGGINGSLSNTDTISATANATATTLASATGSAYAWAGTAYGIYSYGTLTGSLSNSGNISATAAATATAIDDSYAVAHYSSVYGAYLGSATNPSIATGASLTNSGSISATGTYTVTASNDHASVSANGTIAGVYLNGALDGSLSNSGTISASTTTTATDLNGSVFDDLLHNYGLYLNGALNGSLANSGTISATGTATATGTIGTTGTHSISADDSVHGMYLSSGIGGSLNNSGTIAATATATVNAAASNGTASDYLVANAMGIDSNGTLSGNLTNSGTISATATTSSAVTTSGGGSVSVHTNKASATAVYVSNLGATRAPFDGSLTNTGTIIAAASVSSSSGAADAYGVKVGTLNGALSNSGTITGIANDPTNGYSVYAPNGSGTIDNQAGGLLYGNVNAGGTINVTNAGSIVIPTGLTSSASATIGGDYTQLAGGSLTLGAASTSNYTQLAIGGAANLTGSGTLNIFATPNNTLAVGDTLTGVLTAGTGKSGSLLTNGSTISVGGTPLFTYSGVVSGNQINVTVTGKKTISQVLSPISGSALTGLGNTLDTLAANYTGYNTLDPVLLGLYNTYSTAALNNKVEQLSPQAGLDINRASLGVMRQIAGIVQAHQNQTMGLSSGDGYINDRTFWYKPFVSHATQGDRSGISGYAASSGGLALGADERVSNTTRLGGAFSYARTNLSANAVAQSGNVNARQLIFYGSHRFNPRTQLNFQADYGTLSNYESRSMAVGPTTATSTASYNGTATHLGIGVARSYRHSPTTSLIASLRADYTNLHSDGYTESGSLASLSVGSNNTDELIVGVNGELIHSLGKGKSLVADLGAGYDTMAKRDSITSSFVGGGAAFATKGINPSPWVLNAGVGMNITTNKAWNLTARYDVQARPSDFTNQSVSLRVKVPL